MTSHFKEFVHQKKNATIKIYLITAVCAYCSIVYELLLAQCLSVVMGGTILRYSITIGLYLFSLGLGSLWVFLHPRRSSIKSLLIVELSLSVLGVVAPFWIFFGDNLFQSLAKLLGMSFSGAFLTFFFIVYIIFI